MTDYPRLVGAMSLVCGSRPLAEEAVQEALARAWEISERGQHLRSLPAWVTRVAMNLSRSTLRRIRAEAKAKERLPLSAESSPPEDPLHIRRELTRLSKRQREVIVLRYYLDLDLAEIAARLGVAVGTVKTLHHRAVRKLGEAIQPPIDDED